MFSYIEEKILQQHQLPMYVPMSWSETGVDVASKSQLVVVGSLQLPAIHDSRVDGRW